MGVDGARDAVRDLDVQLWQHVLIVHAGLADVTDRSGLDDVAHREALHSLVLRDGTRAVRAAHKLDVTAAVLVASG